MNKHLPVEPVTSYIVLTASLNRVTSAISQYEYDTTRFDIKEVFRDSYVLNFEIENVYNFFFNNIC